MAQRLHANKRAAAERGELRSPLPVGSGWSTTTPAIS